MVKRELIMTRNETFFKILFAISLALLPMTVFSEMFLTEWSISLFIAGILLAKIWLELFKDKNNLSHNIILAINSIAVFTTLAILFAVNDYINMTLAVLLIVAVVLFNFMRLFLFKYNMVDMIEAVDFCHVLFEVFAIVGFAIITFYDLIANIGIFAMLLTAVVSIAYKIYYVFKHVGIKNVIKKRKK